MYTIHPLGNLVVTLISTARKKNFWATKVHIITKWPSGYLTKGTLYIYLNTVPVTMQGNEVTPV